MVNDPPMSSKPENSQAAKELFPPKKYEEGEADLGKE